MHTHLSNISRVLWRTIRTGGPLLFGALLMFIYLYKDTENKDCQCQTSLTTTNNSTVDSWPRCQQNVSVANLKGFNHLSQTIQTFMYYRHCRHFPMILDIPDKCGGANESADVFLLLVIKSPPVNYNHRDVLRKTWAKERLHNGLWIRRIFISGTMGDGLGKEKMNKLLEEEQRVSNDILQWDFDESFFNLTLKQILFLQWLERNCPNAHYLLNGDDDVLANPDNIIEYLQGLKDNNGSKHLFAGQLVKDARPMRSVSSKYFIPFQLQSLNSYPTYCGGGGIIMSVLTALVIHKMSHSISIFPIDDVYIGMCLAKAELTPIGHWGVKIQQWSYSMKEFADPCFIKKQLVVHRFPPVDMFAMWQKMHDPSLKCGK